MIAARIADRPQGGDRRSPDWRTKKPIEPLVQPPTKTEAAKLLNIGASSVTRARHVVKNGTTALQKLVESGAVPVYTAVRVADLDDEEQDEFAHRVANGANPQALGPAGLGRPHRDRPNPLPGALPTGRAAPGPSAAQR